MAGQSIGAIEVKLSVAQVKLTAAIAADHAAMGDCELRGFTVQFQDYEGARAFLGSVWKMATPTTRAYITREAVVRKLDAAIVAAMGKVRA